MVARSVSSEDAPDGLFALVVGLYAGLVVGPLVVGIASPLFPDLASGYVALLISVTLVATVAGFASRRLPNADVRLGRTPRRWLLVGAPAVAVGVAAVVRLVAVGPVSGGFVLLAALAGAGGAFLGAVLALMGRTRYVKEATDGMTPEVTWKAAWPSRPRRTAVGAGGGLMALSVIGFVAGAATDWAIARVAGQTLLPLGAVVATFGQPRTYRATPLGLERHLPVHRQLYRWSRLEGYTVTENAIVVRSSVPWRLPMYWDRSAFEDPDAVLEMLDAHLPRLPAPEPAG